MLPPDGEPERDPLTVPAGGGVPGRMTRPAPGEPAAPEADLERTLGRARRLVGLTWLIALLHATLGLVALRQAALLVDLDRDLITTPSIEAFAEPFGVIRLLLAATVVGFAVLVVRWIRATVPTMERFAALGAVDSDPGASDGASGPRDGARRLSVLLRPAGVPPEQVSWAEVRVGSGRRLATTALIVSVAAVVLGFVAAGGLLAATQVNESRFWRLVAGVDSGLWVLATILTGAVVADVGWRVAVAGRAVGVFAPLSDAPGRLAIRVLPAALLLAGLAPIAAFGVSPETPDCPSASLSCAVVDVPVDHRGGPVQATISIRYGLHPANEGRRGTLVVAVGGPGASGLGSADAMLARFGDALLGRYDIVFWDQRGIGDSDGHDCPVAGGIYNAVETTSESARLFVTACLNEAETGTTGLSRYATSQAAEDLESIRDELGVERFVLYGESYGTELAQIYAAAHPDRLSALILDGAVDLTLTANEFWSTAALGFDAVLEATLDACRSDVSCAADVGDPQATYDRFADRVSSAGVTATFADPDGLSRDHRVERAAFEGTVGSLLYEPEGRGLLMRAVAALDGGDDVPMARLVNLFGSGLSPVSTFAYHAILCADYRVSPTADTADVDAVLESGRRSGALEARTDEVYLAQLPCLWWPDQPADAARPEALTDLPFPVIVLGATMDPITPVAMGRAIAERAADGYLVETRGGPHVTFGRGQPCVDAVVRAFLLEDRLPGRVTACSGVVASPYIPLSPLSASEFVDALDAMTSLENELLADPLYTFWAGPGEFDIGCRYEGNIAVRVGDDGDEYTFVGCEFARGMAVSGSGGFDPVRGERTFDVSFSGGSLEYASGPTRSVRGSFRNESIYIRR